MIARHAKLFVTLHVVSDALFGMAAFTLAYVIRFETDLIPVTRGYPPLSQYLAVLPLVALIVPLAF